MQQKLTYQNVAIILLIVLSLYLYFKPAENTQEGVIKDKLKQNEKIQKAYRDSINIMNIKISKDSILIEKLYNNVKSKPLSTALSTISKNEKSKVDSIYNLSTDKSIQFFSNWLRNSNSN